MTTDSVLGEQHTVPLPYWGMTGNMSDSPGGYNYDGDKVTNATYMRERGGGYGYILWVSGGNPGYVDIGYFRDIGSNDTPTPAETDPYTMPGAWHDWPTQEIPNPYGLYNGTIQEVRLVTIINPYYWRTVRLAWSLDDGFSWHNGPWTLLTGNDWQFFSWNITGDYTFEPYWMTTSSLWVRLECQQLTYWPLFIDYVGVAYNWTLPASPGPPPEEEEDGGVSPEMMLLSMGILGTIGLITTPVITVWLVKRGMDKIMAIIVFLGLGALSLGLFLAGMP